MFSANRLVRSDGRSRLTAFDAASSHRPRSTSMSIQNRDSYGGYSRRSSSEERKSGNGGSVRRFSSVRNSFGNGGKGAVKDTRPLTDKVYQKKKLTELVQFLEENDFKLSVTPAKLMSPSKKEFELIFQFLVNTWDPTFEIKNLEEDAPRILKNIAYPFIPNKSAFTYVARTNFVSLLGVLLFLLDLAKMIQNSDLSALYNTGDSEATEEHAFLLSYILQCQKSGVEDQDKLEVFGRIVRSRNNEDFDGLIQERDLNREKVNKVQQELEKIKNVQIESENINVRITQYEEYLQDMEKRKEKREATIAKLEEDLQTKKSLLEQLKQQLSKRQAIYDAQGFDGKKTLSHIEEQKRELNIALEKERDKLKEIQDDCWDIEINYSRGLDKGNNLCKEFHQAIAQTKDSIKAVLQTLQSIKDSEVQNIIKHIRLEFPEFPQQFNKTNLLTWSNIHEGALEEVQKKISTSNVIIKTLLSASSEELTKIEMEKLQLSAKLKCASSVELQKEHGLSELEKQAICEVKALSEKCDEELKQLDDLRKVSREKEEEYNKLKSDFLVVQKLKLSRTEMLNTYSDEQKKFSDKLASNLEILSKASEECGEEIASAVNQLLKETENDRKN